MQQLKRLLSLVLISLALFACGSRTAQTANPLRFEVRFAHGLYQGPMTGRVYVVISDPGAYEPRLLLGREDIPVKPYTLAMDVKDAGPSATIILDNKAYAYPAPGLSSLPARKYHVQAVFDRSADYRASDSPGNFISKTYGLELNPETSGQVTLDLDQIILDEKPVENENLKYIDIESPKMSAFHGHSFHIRAGLILPKGYENNPDKSYPLWVHIGGGDASYEEVEDLLSGESGEIKDFQDYWESADAPQFILLHLDNAGPYGCPYHVNSANTGPLGDAIVEELIPYVEKNFRVMSIPQARFLEGRSTGGWVALALQIFYPDFFNGAWAGQPDPVDFRSYVTVNIYEDKNAFRDANGKKRPSARYRSGAVFATIEDETRLENMLGPGNVYTTSGASWGAWNAVFGPRGEDGQPRPLWNPESGDIDPVTAEYFKQYDLRLVLETNWKNLASKLQDKLHIWVGDADTYYLNGAVHRLDQFLSQADPPAKGYIMYGRDRDHSWTPKDATQIANEMKHAMDKAIAKN